MIIQAGLAAPPHFFLIGFRAPPGGLGPTAEKRGVIIARSLLSFAGTSLPAGEVRTEDESFLPLPPPPPPLPVPPREKRAPYRYESEIPVWKPVPDVAVVADLETFVSAADRANIEALPDTIFGTNFGTVAIDRGAGFGLAVNRTYGYRPRASGVRLGLAGDPGTPIDPDPDTLGGFKPDQFDLPRGFDNGFANGAPLPGETPFKPGDRLNFTRAVGDMGAPVPVLTIPAAPHLTVTENGAPLDPPLNLAPLVDTVVVDRTAGQFTLVWRASFAWEARFESATLTVQ